MNFPARSTGSDGITLCPWPAVPCGVPASYSRFCVRAGDVYFTYLSAFRYKV
jgi:hypothetical protein